MDVLTSAVSNLAGLFASFSAQIVGTGSAVGQTGSHAFQS